MLSFLPRVLSRPIESRPACMRLVTPFTILLVVAGTPWAHAQPASGQGQSSDRAQTWAEADPNEIIMEGYYAGERRGDIDAPLTNIFEALDSENDLIIQNAVRRAGRPGPGRDFLTLPPQVLVRFLSAGSPFLEQIGINLVGLSGEVGAAVDSTPLYSVGGGMGFDFEFDPLIVTGDRVRDSMLSVIGRTSCSGRGSSDSIQLNVPNGRNAEPDGDFGLGVELGARYRRACNDRFNFVVSGTGQYAYRWADIDNAPFTNQKTQVISRQLTDSDGGFGWQAAIGLEMLSRLQAIWRAEAYVSSIESEILTGIDHTDTEVGFRITRVYPVGDLVTPRRR